jgi:2-keto-4-pentenoate hydratase
MTPVSFIPDAGFRRSGVRVSSDVSAVAFDARVIAESFVRARLRAEPLAAYPGPPPPDLEAAYRCQDEAIALWPDAVAGWKVGWVPEPFSSRFGEERLIGPVFTRSLWHAKPDHCIDVPAYAGGFAAIEAEFVFRLGRDAPAGIARWDRELAASLVHSLHIGMEIASSPLATINDLGAPVIVSDFGNNAGLIVGAEVPDWSARAAESLLVESRIDGRAVGRGAAASLPGGPLAALCFALERNARRGRRLRAGDYVTTGAATGVHDIFPGQRAEACFDGIGQVSCRVFAAARTDAQALSAAKAVAPTA